MSSESEGGSFAITSLEAQTLWSRLEALPLARAENLRREAELERARRVLQETMNARAALRVLGLTPGKKGPRPLDDVPSLATLYERLQEPAALAFRADGSRVPVESIVSPGVRVLTGYTLAIPDRLEQLRRDEREAIREALAVDAGQSLDADVRERLQERLAELDAQRDEMRRETHARIQSALANFPGPIAGDMPRFAEALGYRQPDCPSPMSPDDALRNVANLAARSKARMWELLRAESKRRQLQGLPALKLPSRPRG